MRSRFKVKLRIFIFCPPGTNGLKVDEQLKICKKWTKKCFAFRMEWINQSRVKQRHQTEDMCGHLRCWVRYAVLRYLTASEILVPQNRRPRLKKYGMLVLWGPGQNHRWSFYSIRCNPNWSLRSVNRSFGQSRDTANRTQLLVRPANGPELGTFAIFCFLNNKKWFYLHVL